MPLAGRSAGDATGLLVDAPRLPPCVFLNSAPCLRGESVVSVPSRRRGSGQCCSRLAFVDARIFRSATGVGGVDRHGQREAGVEVVVGVI